MAAREAFSLFSNPELLQLAEGCKAALLDSTDPQMAVVAANAPGINMSKMLRADFKTFYAGLVAKMDERNLLPAEEMATRRVYGNVVPIDFRKCGTGTGESDLTVYPDGY